MILPIDPYNVDHKQTSGQRRQHVIMHTGASGRHTADRDVVRIASEVLDISLDPFQSEYLIFQAVVAGHHGVSGAEKT